MQYRIVGTVMQALEVFLRPGETIYTANGGMAWMMGPLHMETNIKGGVLKGLGCMLTNESMWLTTYTCRGAQCLVVFTPEVPGKIVPLDLRPGQSIIAQRDVFLCATHTVRLEMHFRRYLGTRLFGAEGFILQQITGPGLAFLKIPGEGREYSLKPDQVMKVTPEHIAAFEPTVAYEISRVRGLKNTLFSGTGLFLATLKGPGRVWLQTLPLASLTQR